MLTALTVVLQISTKLKVGVMWDHNGTYMEGIALHYRSHKVVIEVDPTNTDSFTGEPLWYPSADLSSPKSTQALPSIIHSRSLPMAFQANFYQTGDRKSLLLAECRGSRQLAQEGTYS